MSRLLCFFGLHAWVGFDTSVFKGTAYYLFGVKYMMRHEMCARCRRVRQFVLPEMSPSDMLDAELSPLADFILGDRPKECGEA